MDTSLEWKIVAGQIIFTSGHCTVAGEEEDRNYHARTKWRTSWEAEIRKKIWQKIDIFGVWEWMGRLLVIKKMPKYIAANISHLQL